MFTLLTTKRGVYVTTTTHATERAAKMAYNRMHKAGTVDSGATFGPTGNDPIAYHGTGR